VGPSPLGVGYGEGTVTVPPSQRKFFEFSSKKMQDFIITFYSPQRYINSKKNKMKKKKHTHTNAPTQHSIAINTSIFIAKSTYGQKPGPGRGLIDRASGGVGAEDGKRKGLKILQGFNSPNPPIHFPRQHSQSGDRHLIDSTTISDVTDTRILLCRYSSCLSCRSWPSRC